MRLGANGAIFITEVPPERLSDSTNTKKTPSGEQILGTANYLFAQPHRSSKLYRPVQHPKKGIPDLLEASQAVYRNKRPILH